MCLTADETIVLHNNINRVVGKEINTRGLLINNDEWILSTIDKLINKGYLTRNQDFNSSIKKLKATELQQILEKNNMKKSGNKKELINRISKVYYTIEGLELPIVYKATEKGENLIKETTYLLEFVSNIDITPTRAYYIANNYITDQCEDKAIEIYKFELKKLEKTDFINISILINDIKYYYKDVLNDFENTRKYTNINFYINLESIIVELNNVKELSRDSSIYNFYFDRENKSLDQERLKSNIFGIVNSLDKKIYENYIFNEMLSANELFIMFKEDIQDFINLDIWDDELFFYFIELAVINTKKENDEHLYSEILDWLNKKFTPEIDESETYDLGNYDEYIENNSFPLTLEDLLEMKEDIIFYIDKNDGEIIPYLKEHRLTLFDNN